MEREEEVPLLFQFLQADPGALGNAERRRRCERWAQAFEDWLGELEGRSGREYRVERQGAWKRFLGACRKWPWEVQREDLEDHVRWMARQGYAQTTIGSMLGAIRGYYAFCRKRRLYSQVSSFKNFDLSAARPGEPPNRLNPKQEAALLHAVDRERSLFGKRDFAMLVVGLTSCLEVGQIRELKWGKVKIDAEGGWTATVRKYKKPVERRLAAEASAAIEEWLKAAGTWGQMQAEDHLFPPLKEFPREPTGERGDWDWGRGLSRFYTCKILNQYAVPAGLETAGLTWYTLRNTAVWKRLQAGASRQEIHELIGNRYLFKTTEYLQMLFEHNAQATEAGANGRRSTGGASTGGASTGGASAGGASAGAKLRRGSRPQKGGLGRIQHGLDVNQHLSRLPAEEMLAALRLRLVVLKRQEQETESEDRRLELFQAMGITAARIAQIKGPAEWNDGGEER